ncbi:hypothetical protein [Liberibacter crescens]|uniref:hypothetical protein n=1 Tax=Liberibacter crescens TaxID=1273132 RepID=UPI00076331D9|nr:hypothetical protein [Liberibacter crescens]AMC12739.1 hypothetical protein RL73_03270 [Liberibacter crescens]
MTIIPILKKTVKPGLEENIASLQKTFDYINKKITDLDKDINFLRQKNPKICKTIIKDCLREMIVSGMSISKTLIELNSSEIEEGYLFCLQELSSEALVKVTEDLINDLYSNESCIDRGIIPIPSGIAYLIRKEEKNLYPAIGCFHDMRVDLCKVRNDVVYMLEELRSKK